MDWPAMTDLGLRIHTSLADAPADDVVEVYRAAFTAPGYDPISRHCSARGRTTGRLGGSICGRAGASSPGSTTTRR
jgi:hypothetical protein